MLNCGISGYFMENRCWFQRSASQFDSPSLRRVYVMGHFLSVWLHIWIVLFGGVVCGVRASCALTGSSTWPVGHHARETWLCHLLGHFCQKYSKREKDQAHCGLCLRHPGAGSSLHSWSSGGEPECGVGWQHHAAACKNAQTLFFNMSVSSRK